MGNCVGGAICTNGFFNPLRDQKEQIVTPLISSISDQEELRSKQSIINIAGKKMTVKMKLKQGDHQYHQELLGPSTTTVRIRVVMSQKELMKILNDGSNYSSVDHLLNTIKLKNTTRIISNSHFNSSWKPALDSITEDI